MTAEQITDALVRLKTAQSALAEALKVLEAANERPGLILACDESLRGYIAGLEFRGYIAGLRSVSV